MSLKILGIFFFILALSANSFGQPSSSSAIVRSEKDSVELPNTKLGEIMRQWLAAVNGGDEREIKSFVEANFAANAFRYQQSAADYTAFFRKLYGQSGGLDLVKVMPDAQPMTIIAKSKKGDYYARITVGLDNVEKEKLAGLGVEKAQAPETKTLSETFTQPLSEKEMIAAIKSELERRAGRGDFSGVVLIAKDDRILFQNAYGFADREAKIPNDLNTKFHIASVGKMFTAAAIAQLVKAGKLSYGDTIAKVLPDYPNKEVAAKVTIHQLLTHSAGFGTFFESPGFERGKTYRDSTEEIEVYKDEKLFFEPGKSWRYSNAGYSLLGAIIERLSGKTYLEYVHENIFKPLGMRDTYTNKSGTPAPNTSIFYTQSPKDPLGLEPFLGDKALGGSTGTGFGGGFSTAPDLFKFARAYRTGKLLGAEMTGKLVDSKVNVDAKGSRRYGYGIFETESNGERMLWHSGGSRTILHMFWNSGYTVIVQTNAIPLPVNIISNEIVDFMTKQNSLRNGNQNAKN